MKLFGHSCRMNKSLFITLLIRYVGGLGLGLKLALRIIIQRQFIRRSNTARLTTRAPLTVTISK